MSRHSNPASKYQCMEAIAPKSDWLVKIGQRYINLNYLWNENVWNRKQRNNDEQINIAPDRRVMSLTPAAIEKNLYALVDQDPIQNFVYIQRECVKTQIIIPRLALYLSGRTLELIWNKIFSKQNVEEEFVELFYEYFFPTFLQRRYTWFSVHLLIKASKAYPVYFRTTLRVLLKETQITSTVLQDYAEHISKEECTTFMKFIAELQFTQEEFDHILPVLYIMFKKSDITDRMFQFVHANLEMHSSYCTYNKNYGKLLLYFIENISGHDVRFRVLKKVIDNHCTPYKRLCLATLEKYIEDLMALQMDMHDGPRIIIPRPNDDFDI